MHSRNQNQAPVLIGHIIVALVPTDTPTAAMSMSFPMTPLVNDRKVNSWVASLALFFLAKTRRSLPAADADALF